MSYTVLNLEITQEQRAAIDRSVEFLRAHHNGSNSLQNPEAFANLDTFVDLEKIAAAGRVGLKTTMSRDEVLSLSDACLALSSSLDFSVLDQSRIPDEIKKTSAMAAEALSSVRKSAHISNVTFVEPLGAKVEKPSGVNLSKENGRVHPR